MLTVANRRAGAFFTIDAFTECFHTAGTVCALSVVATVHGAAVASVVIASVAFAFAIQFQTSAALCTEAVVAVVTRGRTCAFVTFITIYAECFQASAAVQALPVIAAGYGDA